MADLEDNVQDNLLDAALDTTKDDDAVLGDISHDSTVDDAVEDPVIFSNIQFCFTYSVIRTNFVLHSVEQLILLSKNTALS